MHGYEWPINCTRTRMVEPIIRVRVKRIRRSARIKHVGKSESCMVYQLKIIFKRTRRMRAANTDEINTRIHKLRLTAKISGFMMSRT